VSTSIDFREIYRRYHRLVFWVVRSAGVPEAWVEDVVHDAFLVIHRRLPELDLEDPALTRPRVIGIARNAAYSHRRGAARRRARHAIGAAPEEPSAVDSIVAHRQAWDRVRRFLDELDGPQREAFVLCELEGMAPAELADALQVPRNTVYSRLRLARAKLLDHFSERPPDALPGFLRTASRQGRPTREQEQRSWAALALQLPLGPVAGPGTWLVAGKAALASLGLAAVTLGAIGIAGRTFGTATTRPTAREVTRDETTESSPATAAVGTPPPESASTPSATPPGVPAPQANPAATDRSAVRRATARPSGPAEPTSSGLDGDVALLRQAAGQLEQGEAAAALTTLERHARAHPESALAAERLGLRVRALCAVGSTEQARAIAARHVAEHPGTRLAATLATPCDEPGGAPAVPRGQ
jgi:RNA polymerase sigma factor (sigma-70 family)